jgi:hypothetical protein
MLLAHCGTFRVFNLPEVLDDNRVDGLEASLKLLQDTTLDLHYHGVIYSGSRRISEHKLSEGWLFCSAIQPL